jgi:hypothetical protein
MDNEGLKITSKVSADLEIFPAQRMKVASEILEQFDSRYSEAKKACELMDAFAEKTLDLAMVQVAPVQQQLGHADGGSGQLAAGQVVEPEDPLAQPVSIIKWFNLICQHEGGVSSPESTVLKKDIIVTLNIKFMHIVRLMYDTTNGPVSTMNLQVTVTTEGGCKKGPRVLLERDGDGTPARRFPFWGKVVDMQVASTLPKQYLLPLGDSNGLGPALFLDGTNILNGRRSDTCLAWHIQPVPTQPSSTKKDGGAEDCWV